MRFKMWHDVPGVLGLVFLGIVMLNMTGCAYRMAITTVQKCGHEPVITTRVEKSAYSWREDTTITEVKELKKKWRPAFTPWHWHTGAHQVCSRCGQKFCDHYTREKWVNKVVVK